MLNPPRKILYFEDDQELSRLFIEYLTQQNFNVFHFSSFPEQGIQALEQEVGGKPDFVLLDLNLPGCNGIDICRILKENYCKKNTPIIFVSGKMTEKDILAAYDAGAEDFLVKPIRLKELKAKLYMFAFRLDEMIKQVQKTSGAEKMAFEAMTASAELGEIIRFHEDSNLANNIDGLMTSLLDAIGKFSLKSSIIVFGESPDFYRDNRQTKPLEAKILLAFKNQQRIYNWKNRTFFNYQNFSVLIRNMPIDDEQRYGILKDQLCLLFNGIDSRIHSIKVEKRNKENAVTMKTTADILATMVMETETENANLSQKFESVILNMENNINSDIVSFNLLEEEEKTLLNHVVSAIKDSTTIFENSIQKEKVNKEIISKLLKNLTAS